jgi:tellurite resistance protein TehA-like permease
MAVPVIIVGYMFIGMGIFFTIILIVPLIHQDLSHGFMNRSRENPGDVLLVGPSGQASGGLLLLGTAAQSDFGEYHRGTFLQASAASGLSSASTMFALLLLGFSFILGLMVLLRLVENMRYWKFSLSWWTLIFPIGISSLNGAYIRCKCKCSH